MRKMQTKKIGRSQLTVVGLLVICVSSWASQNGAPSADLDYNQGSRYLTGDAERPKDPQKAFTYFLKAAQQGHAKAQAMVASLYEAGEGVEQNEMGAVEWYTKAAEQNIVIAQRKLVAIYYAGKSVPRNYAKAFAWLLRAVEWGDAQDQVMLGGMYDKGNGVPQNKEKAIGWYIKAAEQDSLVAQNMLGLMYANGMGVPIDYEESVKWWARAVASHLLRPPFVPPTWTPGPRLAHVHTTPCF